MVVPFLNKERTDYMNENIEKLKVTDIAEEETQLAFQIADRYISICETDGGYDYSIMAAIPR